MHAGLTIIDHTATLQPQLAEAVPTVENGLWKVFPDGRMETTWKLRPSAPWHDGTPVTADDFVFTARVAQDPSLVAFRHIAFDAVERVDAPDPRTLVITWQQPFIEADRMFAADGSVQSLPLPRHLLEKAYQDNKAGFLEVPAVGADGFVGAGPFKLKEWVRGASGASSRRSIATCWVDRRSTSSRSSSSGPEHHAGEHPRRYRRDADRPWRRV